MTKERAIQIMIEEGQPDPFVDEILIGDMIDLTNLSEMMLRAMCQRPGAKEIYDACNELINFALAHGATKEEILQNVIESDKKKVKLFSNVNNN